MDDSLLPSALDAPLRGRALDDWIEERSQELESVLARELNRIVGAAVERFVVGYDESQEALTAAIDFSEFESILWQWEAAVQANVLPIVEVYYLTGGVNASIIAPGFPALPATVTQNWTAIMNEGARNWAQSRLPLLRDVGVSVQADIRDKVAAAIESGAATERVRDQIMELTGMSEYRAQVIARTEVNAAYNNGNYQAALALEEFGPVEKVWVSTQDARTREAHVELYDTVVKFSDPFMVKTNDGSRAPLMFPMDMTGPVETWIQCRCHAEELYTGFLRPDGTRAGIDPLPTPSIFG